MYTYTFYAYIPDIMCLATNSHPIFHLQFFLAVANHGATRDKPSKSVIYRWSRKRKRFKVHQEIVTWMARDLEYFKIEDDHYIAVANHVRGKYSSWEGMTVGGGTCMRSLVWCFLMYQNGVHDALPTQL